MGFKLSQNNSLQPFKRSNSSSHEAKVALLILLLLLVRHHSSWLLHVIELRLLAGEHWLLLVHLIHISHHSWVEAHLLIWHLLVRHLHAAHLVLIEHHATTGLLHHVGLWLEAHLRHLRLESSTSAVLSHHSLTLSLTLVPLHHASESGIVLSWLSSET